MFVAVFWKMYELKRKGDGLSTDIEAILFLPKDNIFNSSKNQAAIINRLDFAVWVRYS